MNEREVTPQLVFGVLVLLFGTAFFLDNIDLIEARHFIRLWPLALVVFGGLKVLRARSTAETVGGVVWAIFGVWLLLEVFDVVDIDFIDAFPVAIMIFGGYLIWRAVSPPADAGAAAAVESSSRLSGFAIMSGLQRRSNTTDFRRGDFTAIMGACEVDLTQASITDSTEATIDVFACMGGIEIRVPHDWTVSNKVFPLMGGAEDNTKQTPSGKKHLVLRGVALMGGVEVKN